MSDNIFENYKIHYLIYIIYNFNIILRLIYFLDYLI